ncbi:amino acid adenylation domain-containing protein [Aquimarina sp. W85]|uniref:non-ribosomal peptide synthetase n=1 Tax=Aquimarina rhodophyticola TaxID=3342246 RepID=UPI00366EA261
MIQKKIIANYWRKKIKNFSKNTLMISNSSTNSILIKNESLSYFYKLTSDNHIAEFTIFLTIFNALLQRYFGECDMIFSNDLIPSEDISLLYSFSSINNKVFKQFLQEVKEEVQDVYKHKDYDLDMFQEKEFRKHTPYGFSYNGIKNYSSSFSLNVTKQENKDIRISILFSENFVKKELASHFLNRFSIWVKELEEIIGKQTSQIEIVSIEEKGKLLSALNTSENSDFLSDTIISFFQSQVANIPNNIAIEYEGKQLTYAELNDQSNQLAHYLLENAAVSPGDFVGVKLTRSEKLLISLLAVLKTGATYVPIDVNYPEERIAFIENDSDCKLVIDEKELNNFEKAQANYPKESIQYDLKPSDLAYIIYTSGTTGNPKGVMITHQNAVALINWAKEEFKNTIHEVVYAATSHCFDLSVFELFYTLSVGKKIKLLDNALEIGKYLENDTQVLLNTVPSSIRNVLEEGYDLSNVSAVNLAGEPFPVDIAQKLLTTKAEVRNLYGPSEDTTYSTCYKLSTTKVYTSIPIGKPITNTQVYILDEHMQLLPPGAIGKLYVSGTGVAQGYLNRPELTAESFIENPYCQGERMYDTGDLARWLPDGNIEFLGRKDHQVKLRGYRIELGEIENSISAFSEDILQAVVAIKTVKKEDVLIGYYVENSVVDTSQLRTHLSKQLPSYMIPNYFIVIDSVPLTPNGKVNKKALPEITFTNAVKKDYVVPRDREEEELVRIWEEVLGIDNIGIEDHFFELGGHSLMISQIINRIQKEMDKSVPFKVFYTDPTIKKLRDVLKNQNFSSINKAPESDYYPVTPSQQRLWFLSQFKEGSQAYCITGAVTLDGNIDVGDFEKAFKHIIDRHEILRTYFKNNEEGTLKQYIVPTSNLEFNLYVKDFSELPLSDQSIEEYIKDEQTKKYDLSKAPLLRASLLKKGNNSFVFFLSMHHIISDGWSIEIFTSEVIQGYRQLQLGKALKLPDLPIQFKDYAVWLAETNTISSQKKSKEYWLNVFEGELPVLELPGFINRPLIKTYSGKVLNYRYSKEVLLQLKDFSQKNQATLFMTLMASTKILLSKYSNQKDIIIGTPIAGREHPDLESQIGLYLNTLAIRTQLTELDSFLDALKKEKQQLLAGYSYQEYPFDQLVNQLNLKRNTSRSPLFDVMIVLHNQKQLSSFRNRKELTGIAIEEFKIKQETSQFDLSFTFIEKNEDLALEICYNTDIYEESFIESIFSHLENIFKQVLVFPNIQIKDIDLLTTEEKQEILVNFNGNDAEYPKDKTIVDLFKDQAKKTPDAVALIFEDKKLTYKKLDEESNRLANYLLSNYKIETEDLIGIKLDRSELSVIALLAVLKTGGAYVPIDPDYPQSRIEYVEKDCDCRLTIDKTLLEAFNKAQNNTNILHEVCIKPNNLAYVIYTSGSTGKPKGILIEHQPVVRLVKNTNYIKINDEDKVLGLSSFSFDGSTFDVFMPLLHGATMVISSKNIFLDFNEFEDLLIKQSITSFFITTALFNTIVESELESIKSLKYVLFGGEQVSVRHVRRFKELYPNVKLHHVYGPTENTTYSTYYPVNNIPENIQTIPIGKGISNSTCYILDNNRRLVSIGVIGEIYLGGDGLARGYLNREDLTTRKFVPHPFQPGKRLYRTGDLARWTLDGLIEFVGRIDDQVKIRGYRIELGEIENVLLSQSGIRQAVVVVKKQEIGLALVAYIVSESDLDKKELKVKLSRDLPGYMLPNYYVLLDAIPLTPNGKVDKNNLPETTGENILKHEYIAPRTTTEKEIASIWQDVLHLEQIGVTDNFFELGGHSLMISQIINRIYKNMGKNISYSLFYNNSTIEKLCNTLKDQEFLSIDCAEESDFYPTTPSQQRLWFLSQFKEGTQAYHITGAVALEGGINVNHFVRAFNYVIDRHEILRTCFKNNDNGVLHQYIVPTVDLDLNLSIKDFSESISPDKSIEEYIKEEQNIPYDLSKAPLLKASLLKRGNNHYVFFLSMHHIISDGWSIEILTSEILEGYRLLQSEQVLKLPDLSIQFKDYAVWLSRTNTISSQKESKEYWLDVFQGELPVLELPSFKKRPLIKTYSGNVLTYNYSEKVLSRLKHFSQIHQATLFMTLMSGVKTLLYRYSNQKDIIVGTPIAGREHPDLESQIGLYLNTLAIRTQFDEKDSFLNVLQKEKQHLLDAYSYQDYPFDLLVEQLNLNRDTSRSPLFDVMVVLQNQQQLSGFQHKKSIEGLAIKEFNLGSESSQFDLSFAFIEKEENLSLSISYNTDIYEKPFVEGVFSHLEQVFLQILSSPSIPLKAIGLLTIDEKQIILSEFNSTKIVYDTDKTIVDLFEEQVVKTPDDIAIEYEGELLTYSMLNEKSNQLAHYLRKKAGITENDFVGVKIARSEKLLITLLAVLKLGAAYVPIDINYPQDRINYIEKDSNCKLVIDEDELIHFQQNRKKYAKENIDRTIKPGDLAYVIYTSGTTGSPKGVMIRHQNAVALINWAKEEFKNTDFNVVYASTSHCFDLSIFELFYTLSVSKKIKLLDSALEIGKHLKKDTKVLLNTVPSSIRNVLDQEYDLTNVSAINLAGEAFPVDIAQKLLAYNAEIRNLYGPSEDTTYSTCYKLSNTKTYRSIPIGKPITNTQTYILGECMQLLPIGVAGKLYVSGDGLASGYLNHDKLTSEKFLESPFLKNERIYDTGDLARWLPDGTIEFLGRKDNQVKVRGYRIELEEIEHVLQEESSINHAVVLIKELLGEKYVVAYLTGKDIEIKQVRHYLSKKLPGYMIPTHYLIVDSIPLTPNGKIDKNQLLALEVTKINITNYLAPENDIEKQLVTIWEEVLGVSKIGITSDFFELGGHSLKATQILSIIHKEFGVSINIQELFTHPTIQNLAISIENAKWFQEVDYDQSTQKIII